MSIHQMRWGMKSEGWDPRDLFSIPALLVVILCWKGGGGGVGWGGGRRLLLRRPLFSPAAESLPAGQGEEAARCCLHPLKGVLCQCVAFGT